MDTSVLPFINELARRIRSTDSWWGVFLLFGHYAFLDAGYREAIESFGYRCLGSVPRDFEYGSMVILDVDARTVEYVPNGQP
jgi:hypothetical protein